MVGSTITADNVSGNEINELVEEVSFRSLKRPRTFSVRTREEYLRKIHQGLKPASHFFCLRDGELKH